MSRSANVLKVVCEKGVGVQQARISTDPLLATLRMRLFLAQKLPGRLQGIDVRGQPPRVPNNSQPLQGRTVVTLICTWRMDFTTRRA